MSHQTGIEASESLRNFFGKCRDGRFRVLKICITGDLLPCMELESSRESAGSWEEDWDPLLPPLVDNDQPAYFLYRLDEQDTSGFLWLFISWSPDNSPTRQKMLYASTKATFKKEFGPGQIKDEYFATAREDITLRGFRRHLSLEAAPDPLSRQEEEMKEIKESETRVEIGVDTKQQTMTSLAFPFDREALQALESYAKNGYDYLQFSIDIEKETVMLRKKGVYSVDELAGLVPTDAARYHLFRFKHIFEEEQTASTVFIYSMPGYSVSIKERMLYSSCKNAVTEVVEKFYKIHIDKKIEIESGAELSEQYLQEEIHPVSSSAKPKFARPPAPSKGKKRITKAPPAS